MIYNLRLNPFWGVGDQEEGKKKGLFFPWNLFIIIQEW